MHINAGAPHAAAAFLAFHGLPLPPPASNLAEHLLSLVSQPITRDRLLMASKSQGSPPPPETDTAEGHLGSIAVSPLADNASNTKSTHHSIQPNSPAGELLRFLSKAGMWRTAPPAPQAHELQGPLSIRSSKDEPVIPGWQCGMRRGSRAPGLRQLAVLTVRCWTCLRRDPALIQLHVSLAIGEERRSTMCCIFVNTRLLLFGVIDCLLLG